MLRHLFGILKNTINCTQKPFILYLKCIPITLYMKVLFFTWVLYIFKNIAIFHNWLLNNFDLNW